MGIKDYSRELFWAVVAAVDGPAEFRDTINPLAASWDKTLVSSMDKAVETI